MGLNKKNTNKAINRFREFLVDDDHYQGKITVYGHSKYGCECVKAVVDSSITLSELENLKEGIHNTMSVGIDEDSGKLCISIW